jgi:hypothetical protein
MKILTTTTGTKWNTDIPARSNLINHISDDGQIVMSKLIIKGISGTHTEFGELKTDLIVVDQFGDTHEICEDYIWQ